jgi:hypothetical protein
MATATISTKKKAWKNRIVNSGEQPANQFLAHELNARRHPAKQREALRGSLNELGFVEPVIVSKRTGKMLDGHARVEEALTKDENMMVPFVEVDVTPRQEKLILASLDPITNLAEYDSEAIDLLLEDLEIGNFALQEMLGELQENSQKFSFRDASDDRGQQIADGKNGKVKVVLATDELAIFERAISMTGNRNRGDAVTEIAKAYLELKGDFDYLQELNSETE